MNNSPFSFSTSFKWLVGLPIVFMACLTPWSSSIDLFISQWFYSHEHFSSHPFFTMIYQYGIFPAWMIAIIACLVILISALPFSFARAYRISALFLVLNLGLGSGLIVHTSKDFWGRPRPKQIQQFGGQQAFRPYYYPNFFHQPEPSKSFPSGHASMGFYFFALIILGRHYRSRWLYYTGIGVSLVLGGLLSLARIAQGGHFLSDVLMSALIMWLVSIGLYYKLRPWMEVRHERINAKAT